MKKQIIFLIFILIIFSSVVFVESQQIIFKNIFDFFKQKTQPVVDKKTTLNESNSFLNPLLNVFDFEDLVVQTVEKSSAAVVSIIISKYVPVIEKYYFNPFEEFQLPPELKPFFEFQFEVPQYRQKGYEKQKIGGGSGFIVSNDGLIITNKHVVNDSKAEYTVYLNDGRKFEAKVLALHPVDDLALLKINATNLPTLPLGDSSKLKLGQFVIAIGNALGEFQNTVSFGVISGLKRTITASDEQGNIERLENLIQTDAAINFGNSGGPLLNLKGEVIGVNTAIAGGAENIGFAIPIERAKKMLEEFQIKGKVEVPFLGVYYLLVNEDIQKRFNLPVNYGAFIYRENSRAIMNNSPAEKYGVKDRDIILEVDGEKITADNSLSQIILKKSVGQKVILKILRDNKIIYLSVILGSLPKNLQE